MSVSRRLTLRFCTSAVLLTFLMHSAIARCEAPQTAAPAAPTETPRVEPPRTEPPKSSTLAIIVDPKLSMEKLIERASQAFSDSQFDTALAYLNAAYARNPLPPILFNIAQAQRKGGYTREALSTYQRFVQENPRSPLQPEASAHAIAMQARIEAEQATAEKEQAEQRARERAAQAEQLAKDREAERLQAQDALRKEIARKERPIYKRKWFWGLLAGVVGTGVVIGVAVGLSTRTPPEPMGELPTQEPHF